MEKLKFEFYTVHRVNGEIESDTFESAQEALSEFHPIQNYKLEDGSSKIAKISNVIVTPETHMGGPWEGNNYSGIIFEEEEQ